MTYCCGILVRDGLVMIADTRTNAGLDNISTFRKLHVLQQPGERIMALASAGNLSISQSVVSMLSEGIENPEDRRDRDADERADHVPGGAAHRPTPSASVHDIEAAALEASRRQVRRRRSCSAGRSRASGSRLFMIYSAGNFIECTTDTPYLQIGEHKYGKPVLDRAVTYGIDLYDALKIGAAVDGLHHALEPRRRHADRRPGGAPRRLRRRAELPDRARASPISTTCASAGRRRCAPPISRFRARPTSRRARTFS